MGVKMKKVTGSFFIIFSCVWINSVGAELGMDLDTIVITSNRSEQQQYEVTGNVTVITKEDIQNSNAQNVADVLSQALGVFVSESGTVKSRTIDIRGFGDTASRNVLVLVNGRRINSVDISGPELMQVPIGAVERVEIIRGGGSVLYGDNAVGGVVNIITKKGEGDLSGKTGFTYGSYDQRGNDLELSGAHKGIGYYVYSNYADNRGYRDNSDLLTRDFNGRLSFDPNEHISVDVNTGSHRDDVGLPGGLNRTELEQLGRQGSANPEDFAKTKDQFVQVTTAVTPWTQEGYLGDFIVDYYYRDREVFDFLDSMFGSFTTNRDIKTNAFTGKYIFDKEIFDRDVNFVTGIDHYDTENDILSLGFGTDDLTIHKTEYGAFGFLEFEALENLYVNAGKRFHKAEYTFDSRSSGTYEQQDPDQTVATGGLKYEYAKGSNVHFNFQQTFRFLATDEWFSSFSGLNTSLEHQQGKQYETGIKHNFDNKLIASITAYLMEIENEIFFDPTDGFFGSNSNYGKTLRRGLEVDQRVDILAFCPMDFLDQLEFFVNYSYQEPEFRDGGFDGKDIPMAPRHQANQGFNVRLLKNYYVSLSGHYVGSRYAINDTLNQTAREKPHYVTDGKISYKKEYFELFAAVNNIFNQQYNTLAVKSSTSTVKDYFPAAEKNYNFGVNLKF